MPDDTSQTTASRARLETLAERYRLVLPERHQLRRTGELAGRGTGSSIEYQDRKDYVPGDDLRHIDWRAFARNDRLTVKLYREEISPSIDLFIDATRSMAATPGKSARRHELAWFLHRCALRRQAHTHLYRVAASLLPEADAEAMAERPDEAAESPLPALAGAPACARPGIKILLSDFLFPLEPRALLARFPRADRVVCTQLLSAFEADPPLGEAAQLEDAESGLKRDVRLDRATVEGYHRRLDALREDLDRALRAAGGAFACLREDDSLDAGMAKLLRAGVLEC